MPVDVNENTIRIRQRDPSDFQDGSFRTIDITSGVKAVIGRLKGETSTTVQTYLFDRDKFTTDEARAWIRKHAQMQVAPENGRRTVFFVSVFSADTKGPIARAGILRTGTWRYKGDLMKVTVPFLEKIVANFSRFQRADDVPLDYEHASTPDTALRGKTADERRAAGWLQKLELEDKGNGKAILWAFFRLVGDGIAYVKKGEFRFCSVELDRDYLHPEADESVGPYLEAVALTNRPFIERLPGMVVLSKRARELTEAGEERAAHGSDSPDTGPRADIGKGEGMKINLSQYGGPAEATEEDVGKLLASQQAQIAKAQGEAKAAAERATKAEGESKVLLSKFEASDAAIRDLQAKDNDREFERVFRAAKEDRKGARAIESQRVHLRALFDTYSAQGKREEFEKFMAAQPVLLATQPVGSGGSDKPELETAQKKFTARVNELRDKDPKLTWTQAAVKVAERDPKLEASYRAELVGPAMSSSGVPSLMNGEEVV